MTDAETLNELGPTTKALALASGHAQQIASLLCHFRDRTSQNEFARVVEQIESVFTAAQQGVGLVYHTYDDEMALVNLVSSIASFSGYEEDDNDEEVTFRCGSAHINIRYTTSDEAGKPCAAILVNP